MLQCLLTMLQITMSPYYVKMSPYLVCKEKIMFQFIPGAENFPVFGAVENPKDFTVFARYSFILKEFIP